MATTTIKNGAGADVTVELPLAPGRSAAATSRPIVLSTEDKAVLDTLATAANQTSSNSLIGGVTEAAPASDTASSGLNGRLQRIAQRQTSTINLLVQGTGVAASSLRVNLATDVPLPAGTNNIGDVDVLSLPALPAGANAIGTVGVTALPAIPAGNNNIGDVDIASMPALPAGTNNIGDVDVLSLPALPAGTNNIGDVDVLSLPALPAGSNNIGLVTAVGGAAHDAAVSGNPVLVGFRSSAIAPSAVSADSEVVMAWALRNGTLVTSPSMAGANAANGLTTTRVVAAATTNATSVKASTGRIVRLDLFNTNAAIRYVKFYNKASAPTVGTDVPVWTLPIPPNSGFSSNFTFGKAFATGIAYAITAGLADADTAAVAAGDIHGSIDWV